MAVKRKYYFDPDLKEGHGRIEIDLLNPAPEDVAAVGELFYNVSPAGRIENVRREFKKLPEDLQERKKFDRLAAQERPFDSEDALQCEMYLRIAKQRHSARGKKNQSSKGGKESSKRLGTVYELIQGWIYESPDITNKEILSAFESSTHEVGGVDVYVDGDQICQAERDGTSKNRNISVIQRYATEIRKGLKKSG